MKKKQAQLQIGFNWIYILIAGGVILLFFMGIVIKQKVVSEQKLSATVLRKIEGIFIGAGLTEKTVNVVEVPELTLVFTCDDATSYSDYAVKGTGVKSETSWQPIFAPKEITSKKIVTWTLEWQMPFKIINYLFISAPNIKYYIFSNEYVLPEQFNQDCVVSGDPDCLDSASDIKDGNEDQVRLVFVEENPLVPAAFRKWPDTKVTAVQFKGQGIIFYEKKGLVFEAIDSVEKISSFNTVDNPNLYGAIFTTDVDAYKCNLRKAFKRLEILSRIYKGKAETINDHFFGQYCGDIIAEHQFDNIIDLAGSCAEEIRAGCAVISNSCSGDICYAGYVLNKNEELNAADCPVIY